MGLDIGSSVVRLQSDACRRSEGIGHVISSALCSGETFAPLNFLPLPSSAPPMSSNNKAREILVPSPLSCRPSHPADHSTVIGQVCTHNQNEFALRPLLVTVCFRGALPGHLVNQQIVSFTFLFWIFGSAQCSANSRISGRWRGISVVHNSSRGRHFLGCLQLGTFAPFRRGEFSISPQRPC